MKMVYKCRIKKRGLFTGGLICFLLFSVPVFSYGRDISILLWGHAKKITVYGVVTSASNEPLPGVTVEVKGTGKGGVTDEQGKYKIEGVLSDAILVFSSVGYESKTVKVSGRAEINVELETSSTSLDQLVVVGYGTEKKANLTGAVSTVSSEQIEKRSPVSLSRALEGIAPGVTVTSQTGAPGRDHAQIHIRGINSFGGSSSAPLVMIDGVAGSIDDIDANMIKSISVLKDAASAAIYGSRAANGVILITTKNGKDKFSINYKGYIGKQSATDIPEVVNGLKYMEVFNDASMNDNNSKIYDKEDIEKFRQKYKENPDNYDWQKALLQGSGLIHSHYLSASVNNGIVSVMPSLSFVDQQGIIKNTNFKRYMFRNNMKITPNDQFEINVDISATNKNRLQVQNENNVWNYLGRMPTNIPIRYDDLWSEGWVKKNPVGMIEDGGGIKTNNIELIGNLSVSYKPTTWLTLSGRVAPRYLTKNIHNFQKSVMTYHEDGSEAGAARTYDDLTESGYRYFYGTYLFKTKFHKRFDNHNLTLLAGTSRETYDEKYLNGYRRDFVFDDYEQLAAGADNETKDNGGKEFQWLLVSAFGRLKYSFEDKYLFEANLRYDGSSRFINKNQWSVFPSFSAGWILSREPFMDNIEPTLNFLKLRASWGKLGNQVIGNSYYPFSEPLSLGSVSMGGNVYQMIEQTTLSNPSLKWEKTTMKDIGIDINLFHKLSITFDWYDKKTDGILLKLNTSQLTGLASPYQNAAVVSNKGWEFSTNYENTWNNFFFRVGINLSDVRNEILDMHGQSSGNLLRQQEGSSINSIYGYVSDGLYQTQQDIDKGPKQFGTLQPGDIRYKDIGGATDSKGNPIPDGKITDADKTIIGSTIPRYTYGLNLGFAWKGLSLDVFIQGVGKVDGYLNSHYVIPAANSSSIKPWQLDYWREDNRDAALPRVSISSANNTQNSTFWMRSAAYFRLKNFQLGYKIPQSFLNRFGIKGLFVYLSGQNVFTHTNFYQGYDPEINYDANAADGVELGSGMYYPQIKEFRFGINLKL